MACPFQIRSIDCHSVPVGAGTINSQHGLLPLPAPATAILLQGQRIRTENVPLERCTPTGAAFLASLPKCERPDGQLLGSGFGAGSRDPQAFANILRVMLIEGQGTNAHNAEAIFGRYNALSTIAAPNTLHRFLSFCWKMVRLMSHKPLC